MLGNRGRNGVIARRTSTVVVVTAAIIGALSGLTVPLATPAAAAEVAVFSDGFEGTFPGTTYIAQDETPWSGLDYWGQSAARASNGSYGLWCAQVGDQSGAPNEELGLYDTFMKATLGFRIPDLSNWTTANLTFQLWLQADWPYDAFSVLVGTSNATKFYALRVRNDTAGWTAIRLPILTPMRYVEFEFYSNSDTVFEGAYVDDVAVTVSGPKDVQPPEIVHTPVTTAQAGDLIPIVATISDSAGVAGAQLRYYNATADSWASQDLWERGPGEFVATMSGQPAGTTLYYLVASDTNDNVAMLPAGGKDSPYAIAVVGGPADNPTEEAPPIRFIAIGIAAVAAAIGAGVLARRRSRKRAETLHDPSEVPPLSETGRPPRNRG